MSNFRKDDRDVVIIILVVVIISLILFPYIKGAIVGETDGKDTDSGEKSEKVGGDSIKGNGYYYVPEKQGELFYFDPNTADSTQLLRLGLRPWQVKNIYKYRAAGGRYREASDFARLYGLTAKQYERLLPYIRIVREPMAADVYGKNSNEERHSAHDSLRYVTKISKGEKIDINTADTTQLKRIPGIGSYYARQIVGKRQRVGGFARLSQLKEIDGFPESALEYMTIEDVSSSSSSQQSGITMLKINHLDVKRLSQHPYIRYVQAKDIFAYRRLHGPITSIDALYRLPSFTQEEVKRLEPYLDFSK